MTTGKTEARGQIDKMTEVMKALADLGYDTTEKVVTIRPVGGNWDRARVSLNGEAFGIYDFAKHTFVD